MVGNQYPLDSKIDEKGSLLAWLGVFALGKEAGEPRMDSHYHLLCFFLFLSTLPVLCIG